MASWLAGLVYLPKTTGVGLAQDTVFRRGQGVEPEVSGALVGSRLRGRCALKPVVTGKGKLG